MRTAVRLFAVVGLLAAAHPALAQPLTERMDAQLRASEVRARLDQIEQEAVRLHNELVVLEAQARTEQALSDLRARTFTPRQPPPTQGGAAPADLATIPDAALAASNARVKAAAGARR